MGKPHFIIATYPAQGHINPSLHFAERLIRATGARVTFATSVSAFRRSMISDNHLQFPENLDFLEISDTLDGDDNDDAAASANSTQRQLLALKRNGTQTLTEFIIRSNGEGDGADSPPVTCLVHTLLLSWVAKVGRDFHLPSAVLWIQPAMVFNVYYFHFNGYADVVSKTDGRPFDLVEYPNLPPLCLRDLPSFVVPSNTYISSYMWFKQQMEFLGEEESDTKILVNTFDELEPEALTAISNLKMIAVGPLLPLEIFRRVIDDEILGNSNQDSREYEYTQWLDSKPDSSVIYVSFGTVAVLSEKQLEELAGGLIGARRPFLWVITDKPNSEDDVREIDKIADFRDELDEIGMIVSWCSQVEVLKHRAVGCFVTHCGWNSTLESLVLGVPVVAFPRWTDQPTNAKLLEDSWKTGVRVRENKEGIVESGEIRRCLEAVMVEKAAELRRNAKRWKELAAAAAGDGGTADKNVKAFADEISGNYHSRRM